MRIKWMKKRFTFMVIPDANSGVVRFRISAVILYLLPILLLMLVILLLCFYIIQMKSQEAAKRLESELSGRTEEFQFTVSGKNKTIDDLQNEVIRLSQQANDIQLKIDELHKLERDVKSITGAVPPDSNGISAKSGTAGAQGVGGEESPVTDENMSALVAETKTQFTNLGEESKKLVDSLSDLKEQILETRHQLQMTPTIWPVDSRTVTSGYGYRKDPFTGLPSFHNGIDIGGSLNDPVYSAAEGIVQTTASDLMHGNNIIIKHADGIGTWYMHLNKILVKEGETVTKGQQIGQMGTTGRSTGVHLHYSVIKNGAIVDPKPYLSASRKED